VKSLSSVALANADVVQFLWLRLRRAAVGGSEAFPFEAVVNGGWLGTTSRVCIGHKNDLGIVIAGTKGTLRWRQEDPECLTICLAGQPDRTYWRGAVSPGDGFLPKDMPADLMAEPTIPSGHPEAFHDAFARLHRCFEADVRKWKAGGKFVGDGSKYANIEDGWMGIAFIETCVKSSRNKGVWTPMPKAI